jgi:hypothetical protein
VKHSTRYTQNNVCWQLYYFIKLNYFEQGTACVSSDNCMVFLLKTK